MHPIIRNRVGFGLLACVPRHILGFLAIYAWQFEKLLGVCDASKYLLLVYAKYETHTLGSTRI